MDAAAALVASLPPETRALLANAISGAAGLGVAPQQRYAQPPPPPQPMHQQQGPYSRPPPQMTPVTGLTDRRFEGQISSFFQEKGFGFIRCNELRASFPDKDVFLHRNQLGNFKEGDMVSFSCSLNRQGKPQAMELAPSGDPAPQPQGPALGAPGAPGALPAAPALVGGVAGSPLPPPPPPAPAYDGWSANEVEIPEDLVAKLVEGLAEIKERAGGDISITIEDRAGLVKTKLAVVRGPKLSASLGAILMLQEVANLQ